MSIKVYLTLFFAGVCSVAFGQSGDDLEKKMLNDCKVLAKEINKSHGAGISLNDISSLVTWRAACADRPPTGPGNVTALCQGKRITDKGENEVFFWQKSERGKLNSGYFVCGG